MPVSAPASLHAILDGAIDYAGLFPPAALTMADAVAEYRACRATADRWALGRFVVPAARLLEFQQAGEADGLLPAPAADPVHLCALALADAAAGLAAIDAFHASAGELACRVVALECRATTPEEATRVTALMPRTLECWVEIPLGAPPGPLIEAVLGGGARPKIRVGGIMPDLFPDPDALLDFLVEAVRRETPFKATAGLHHPLRGAYPYTYEPGSAVGPMFGYLNLFLATALLLEGAPPAEARRALLEEDPEALDLADGGVTWRGRRLDIPALKRMRREGLRAFGSCSFREPMRDILPLLTP